MQSGNHPCSPRLAAGGKDRPPRSVGGAPCIAERLPFFVSASVSHSATEDKHPAMKRLPGIHLNARQRGGSSLPARLGTGTAPFAGGVHPLAGVFAGRPEAERGEGLDRGTTYDAGFRRGSAMTGA